MWEHMETKSLDKTTFLTLIDEFREIAKRVDFYLKKGGMFLLQIQPTESMTTAEIESTVEEIHIFGNTVTVILPSSVCIPLGSVRMDFLLLLKAPVINNFLLLKYKNPFLIHYLPRGL
jgi:hypothetical protein